MEKKEYVKPVMEIIRLESKTPVLQDCSNIDWNDEVGYMNKESSREGAGV